MNPEFLQLLQRIEALEKENESLRHQSDLKSQGETVIVPTEMKPLFDLAQKTVSDYFTNLKMQPDKGTIEINDQRYILIRASALSKDFLDTIQNLYADRGEVEAMAIGKNLLFDIAHTLGINDGKNFHTKMKLTEPIAKLSAGPIHFAFTGWAFVEILPESNPSPDDNFYLIYNHPFSFEADSWIRSGKKSDTPVCIMNAGYSSGWCEESFGIPLTAVEVSCIAKGDDSCTFIMSPPHMIKEHLNHFNLQPGNEMVKQTAYDIPTFFVRKKVEEEMQRSKALAESSVKAKEDFISNMSHELRTPLSAVLGFTELLNKTTLNATQKEYLEAISSSGNNLLSIINDILDLSKIDAGKFNIENIPFSIPELLHSVQAMFTAKAKKKNLEFSVAVDTAINYPVSGDSMRLTQILVNLIGNAIKFTETGKVNLLCTKKSESENAVEITFCLTDTGIGIPEEKLEVVFERFTQADTNITRRYGGTGLGLAITKQLVELLGGNIYVKSKEGIGTEFTFTLNFTKSLLISLPTQSTYPRLSLNDRNAHILVVEDNPMNQKLTATILSNNGFTFSIAENGKEAIMSLKASAADLILMDIQMPVMDGYEATCIIRDEMQIQTPIIAMTAHAMAGEKEKCRQLGFNDYLPKPFTEELLMKKVESWLNVHQQIKDNKDITDLSFLRKQTRNNETVIKDLIQTFIVQTPVIITELEVAVSQKDYPVIYKKLHVLRNSVALFGLNEHIGDILIAMENLAHSETGIDLIKNKFDDVKHYCKNALIELKNK